MGHGVVPEEEVPAVSPGVMEGSEAIGEARAILEGLEWRLGERVVVGDARRGVALGHAEIGQEQSRGFRGHAGASIGMDRQLPLDDSEALGTGGDELLGQRR